jgi:hypothetical protein
MAMVIVYRICDRWILLLLVIADQNEWRPIVGMG